MGSSYKWTDEDINFLIENWMYMEDQEIAEHLGIIKQGFGKHVVTRKRIKLGLIGKSKRIRSDKSGYKYYIEYDKRIFTHREKIENQIGRKLTNTEIVHHIDGDKNNDDLSNLYLCKDNSAHQFLHNQIEKIAFELLKRGEIVFKDGNYYLQ